MAVRLAGAAAARAASAAKQTHNTVINSTTVTTATSTASTTTTTMTRKYASKPAPTPGRSHGAPGVPPAPPASPASWFSAALGGSVILPVASAALALWSGWCYYKGRETMPSNAEMETIGADDNNNQSGSGWISTVATVEPGLVLFKWSGARLGVSGLKYVYKVDSDKTKTISKSNASNVSGDVAGDADVDNNNVTATSGDVYVGSRVRVGHPYIKWEPIPWVPGRGIGPKNSDISNEFVPGAKMTVYYNPKNPSESTVVRGPATRDCATFGAIGTSLFILRAIARR